MKSHERRGLVGIAECNLMGRFFFFPPTPPIRSSEPRQNRPPKGSFCVSHIPVLVESDGRESIFCVCVSFQACRWRMFTLERTKSEPGCASRPSPPPPPLLIFPLYRLSSLWVIRMHLAWPSASLLIMRRGARLGRLNARLASSGT